MTRFEVDRACGQTPCLCGDIETWHPECFKGKSASQIKTDYDRAYRIARDKLKVRVAQQVVYVLRIAKMQHPFESRK